MSTRFVRLEHELERKGVKDPAAVAASIGRKKYGKKKFEKMAEAGKRRKHHSGRKIGIL